MFRDRATLKFLFKMCFLKSATLFPSLKVQHLYFLSNITSWAMMSLFSHRISPGILIFLFSYSWGRWRLLEAMGRRMISPLQRGKGKVLLINVVLFLMTVQAFQPRAEPCFQCPFDWIKYRGKCYYFSEVEGNWTYSQDNCSALGASLAMLDSMEDLVRGHEDLLGMGGKDQKHCIWNLLVSVTAIPGSFLKIWGENLVKRPWGYVIIGLLKFLTKANCCKDCRDKLLLDDTFW